MMDSPDSIDAAGRDGAAPRRVESRARLLAYSASLIAVPIVILTAAILVIPTDWVAERSANTFLPSLGYGSKLRNADCNVVVYGDSSALIGVSPDIIRKRTGLSTCNIAEVEGVTMVNGTLLVDDFLKHNPRPRFLVFLFAPENLDPESRRGDIEVPDFEGITYRFSRPDKFTGLIAMLRHPEALFSWVDHGVRLAIHGLVAKPFPPEVKMRRYRAHGQGFLDFPTIHACNYRSLARPPNMEFVKSLRSKYNGNGTTVLVDSMMLPACDPDIGYFRRTLSGLIDNQIATLPVSDYYGGGRHVNPSGSIPLSNMVADQILDRYRPSTGAR